MRTYIFVVLSFTMPILLFAQTERLYDADEFSSVVNSSITIKSGESLNTGVLINSYPFSQKEEEWVEKYTDVMYGKLKAFASESDKSSIKADFTKICNRMYHRFLAENTIHGFSLEYEYAGDYDEENGPFIRWEKLPTYITQRHKLFSNKAFRQFAYQIVGELLCETVRYYPKDYKRHLVNEFERIVEFVNDISKHDYSIIANEYDDYFLLDGKEMTQDAYGIKGFILRRIFWNGVPYEEVKDEVNKVLAKIKGADNSNNVEIMSKYKINNDMFLCVGSKVPFLLIDMGADTGKHNYKLHTPFLLPYSLTTQWMDARHYFSVLEHCDYFSNIITYNSSNSQGWQKNYSVDFYDSSYLKRIVSMIVEADGVRYELKGASMDSNNTIGFGVQL